MNAIFSGVAAPAAMIRSPSFSRSVSSTTITSSPWRMASIASLMVSSFMNCPMLGLRPDFMAAKAAPIKGFVAAASPALGLKEAHQRLRLHACLGGDALGQGGRGGADGAVWPVQPVGDGIEHPALVHRDQPAGLDWRVCEGRTRQGDAQAACGGIQHEIVILEPPVLRPWPVIEALGSKPGPPARGIGIVDHGR